MKFGKGAPTVLVIILPILLYFAVNLTNGLDMKGAFEKKCFDIKPSKLDMAFAVRHKFYFIKSSRLHLYHLTAQLWHPKDPATVEEGSMYYDACIRWNFFRNGSVIVTGYGGEKMTNYITKENPAVNGQSFKPIGGGDFSGNWWVTLTDNRTYAVAVGCDKDNAIFWGVISTTAELPPATIDKITKHVKGMGFSQKFFTELRFDTCPDEDDH